MALDWTCGNCGGRELGFEIAAHATYRPTRIVQREGRGLVLLVEHEHTTEDDGPGTPYCRDCGEELSLEDVGAVDWQDEDTWAAEQVLATTVSSRPLP